MGLDATVRCRCFEEGRLKPGPIPAEDLYIDKDGYLSSRTLDAAREKYDYRRFDARYGELRDAFDEWLCDCCEHEDGDYFAEWVSNWAGVAHFCALVEEAGGEAEFPLLSSLIPKANGGVYPAEKARDTLDELQRFIAVVSEMNEWTPGDVEGEPIASSGEDPFLYEGKYPTAERLRSLLRASLETGNPIRWC